MVVIINDSPEYNIAMKKGLELRSNRLLSERKFLIFRAQDRDKIDIKIIINCWK